MNMSETPRLEVFLIEPSPTQQAIIKQHLRACGIEDVTSMSSGQDALQRLRHLKPDLMISAMYLPDMTGVELIHAIRADGDSYDMAFLLISSETNIKYLEPIRQAGAIAILPKPFSQKELDTALSSTLDYLHPDRVGLDHLDVEDIQVLLVDDSEFSRKYITRVLNNIGIDQITCAEDGKQGLQLFHQQYFDLVITDFNMPEMNGLQLVKAIRGDQQTSSVPILMVTSEQSQNRLAAVENAGVSAILDKPFEPISIKRLITQLLN